ncbi:MAG: aldehyde dehydrogenase family protein, partial [Paracoccaceae bacterium]|nr:aldehyde dehydrogenase family protein [Paracoccaceae bacterium]
MYQDLNLFIHGGWRAASDRATKPVTDPATEEVLGTIAEASPEDVDAALSSAKEGFAVWRRTGTWDRAAKMRKVADLIRERQVDIARLMSLETGKPMAEA